MRGEAELVKGREGGGRGEEWGASVVVWRVRLGSWIVRSREEGGQGEENRQ